MVLHDWQRGKLPFFVPPPQQEVNDGSSELPTVHGIDEEAVANNSQASAALQAIANVMSSQQQRSVPVQRDLFNENELNGEMAIEELPNGETAIEELTNDETGDENRADESKMPSSSS